MIERLQAGAPLSLAPEWTDANTHDPGVTLLELHAFLAESELYRISAHGQVNGLAVQAGDGDTSAVRVSPGVALDPQGQSLPSGLPRCRQPLHRRNREASGRRVRPGHARRRDPALRRHRRSVPQTRLTAARADQLALAAVHFCSVVRAPLSAGFIAASWPARLAHSSIT